MNVDTDRVRQRAYDIWIADGCPAGKEVEHWKRAERELFAETNVAAPETGGNGQEPKQHTGSNGVNRPSEEQLPQPVPRERLRLNLSGNLN